MYPLVHLLQVSDVLDVEFASALAELVPVIAWEPQRSFLPSQVRPGTESERLYDEGSSLRLRRLPLMRGFARGPISAVINTGRSVVERLLLQTPDPANTPLICTVPFFADVAELWPGPVIYWLTDLIAEYSSADRDAVQRLDRRMCRVATLVCPNSRRIADYLLCFAQCDHAKIQIVPNATRASNILSEPPTIPGPRPDAIASVKRPIAGVIGNLAGNMDWLLLDRLVELTPAFEWVFVGPTSMHIADRPSRAARASLLVHPRAHFVGGQPYGALATYARTFDVAVLPYKRREPTFSGSSTRFYEHLAACRPMIATPGLQELIRKVPLLTLFDSAERGAEELERLRKQGFEDGFTHLRWETSQNCTWQARARMVLGALQPQHVPSNLPEIARQYSEMVAS
jgi:hypothetical protein